MVSILQPQKKKVSQQWDWKWWPEMSKRSVLAAAIFAEQNSSVTWSWMVAVSLLHLWYNQRKVRHLMRKMKYMTGQKLLSNYYTCFGIMIKLVTLYMCSLVSYLKPQIGIIFEHCKQIILLSPCGRNEQFLNCTLLNIVAEAPIYPGGRHWARIS